MSTSKLSTKRLKMRLKLLEGCRGFGIPKVQCNYFILKNFNYCPLMDRSTSQTTDPFMKQCQLHVIFHAILGWYLVISSWSAAHLVMQSGTQQVCSKMKEKIGNKFYHHFRIIFNKHRIILTESSYPKLKIVTTTVPQLHHSKLLRWRHPRRQV